MPGVVIWDDDFTTLTANATLHGRIPPVTTTNAAYSVEPNNVTSITGAGSGLVKFNEIVAHAKIIIGENAAISVTFNDNSGNERLHLFVRDSQSTPSQRYGFWVRFATRELGTTGYFRIASRDNYVNTSLFPDVPWTYSANGINNVAIESIDNTHRIVINNVVAYSFTSQLHVPNGSRVRAGFAFFSEPTAGSSIMRVDRVTAYDSIVTQAVAEYPVVQFG